MYCASGAAVPVRFGKERQHAAENTEAWGNAKATYEYLVEKDYKIATAFVAKFNHAARKLFGVQIQALPDPKRV